MELQTNTIELENELSKILDIIIKEKGLTFGKTKYRIISRNNSIYEKAYRALITFANQFVFCKYTSIKVIYQNENGNNQEHLFIGSKKIATCISLGDYSDGFLEHDGLITDSKYLPHIFILENTILKPLSFGYRFFILFYNI